MAKDLTARRTLFETLLNRVGRHIEEGRTNLTLLWSPLDYREGQACLYLCYVLTLYDQVFSKVVGIPLAPKKREEFVFDVGGRIYLGGNMIALGTDAKQADAALRFYLEAQTKFVDLPEAEAVGAAYREVQTRTEELKRSLHRKVIAPTLLGICDLCRPFV